jgi:hypothetical protein
VLSASKRSQKLWAPRESETLAGVDPVCGCFIASTKPSRSSPAPCRVRKCHAYRRDNGKPVVRSHACATPARCRAESSRRKYPSLRRLIEREHYHVDDALSASLCLQWETDRIECSRSGGKGAWRMQIENSCSVAEDSALCIAANSIKHHFRPAQVDGDPQDAGSLVARSLNRAKISYIAAP